MFDNMRITADRSCMYVSDFYAEAYEIHELFAAYIDDADGFTYHQKRQHLKRIILLAREHITIKKEAVSVDEVLEKNCSRALNSSNTEIELVEYLVNNEPGIGTLEAAVINWYQNSFMPSEKSCACCKFNVVWHKS
ncbi:hypothetical protein MTBPR1_10017 [Candidatus Terasakiella magnetica]|uniref:Uncharacterized protein n=1 Tax=Candidatus Terasakiella magnetica TaxID=1867952 RepID=A0A1C3RBY2_9PROT|nr:hypothetical protein [Candidatus Terasakiella magnetica]SCA54770.1 hypothetical protein MTBPR1_10017 [Candidatus Terasakiella magnetica]